MQHKIPKLWYVLQKFAAIPIIPATRIFVKAVPKSKTIVNFATFWLKE